MKITFGLGADNGTVIGPAPDSPMSASDIVFYVSGTNAQSSFTYAVNISPKSNVSANIYAPNGTILLDQGTSAMGSYFAKDVRIGKLVQLRVASAFVSTGSQSLSAKFGEVQEESSLAGVPTEFSLSQNFPNPFNPTTQIRYGLPIRSHVTVSVYNLLGQEVIQLIDEDQSEGFHQARWDGRNKSGVLVSSGIYFYRIHAGNFIGLKKMIMLK